MQGLKGKSALVTGASGGIGGATARRFANEGIDLFLTDLDTEAIEVVAADCRAEGVRVEVAAGDVRDDKQVDDLVAAHVAAYGGLDILANIAGVQRWSHTHEHTTEDFRLMIDVNIGGTFFFSRAALPHLVESKGCIINTASTTSFDGLAYSVVYSATKGAVRMLTKSLALEYAGRGVRVNAVAPGGIDTGMSNDIAFPDDVDFKLVMRQVSILNSDMQPPSVIAGVMAFLASDDAGHITGETILVDGAATA